MATHMQRHHVQPLDGEVLFRGAIEPVGIFGEVQLGVEQADALERSPSVQTGADVIGKGFAGIT